MMQASPAAYSLIEKWEDTKLVAYQDSVGIWTLGTGTTRYPDGRPVREGDTCTEEEAREWLEYWVLEHCEKPLNEALRVPVNQAMFDSLVSWTYNVGEGAMRNSTLIRLLNEGRYVEAQDEFDRWVKAGGQTLRGLQRRRDDEEALFRSGVQLALNFAKDQGWA